MEKYNVYILCVDILQQLRKTFPDTLLRLTELSLTRLLVELVERILITFLFKIGFDHAELLAELAVQDLVVKNVLEVSTDSSSVKLQSATELTVLRYR